MLYWLLVNLSSLLVGVPMVDRIGQKDIRFSVTGLWIPGNLYKIPGLEAIQERKFENRRNNIYLIPLLDACSFSRWCTILKMFEIPT